MCITTKTAMFSLLAFAGVWMAFVAVAVTGPGLAQGAGDIEGALGATGSDEDGPITAASRAIRRLAQTLRLGAALVGAMPLS